MLLYADDTIMFVTSEETLIQSLNLFSNYCNQWKLDINYDKTKLLVFGDRISRQRHIRIENYMIEMLNEFNESWIYIQQKPKVFSYEKTCCKSSKESTFCLYTKIRNLDLSIACQLKLFGNLVVPILSYNWL